MTFILIDFAWLFFRAQTVSQAFSMIKKAVEVFNPWILFDESLYRLGVDRINFHILLVGLLILLAVDIAHEKKVKIREWYSKQNVLFRWGGYICAVLVVILFGIYGVTYDSSQFLYFQF